MPVITSALLVSGIWLMGPNCPIPLNSNRTTVGAITSSSSLSVCVSNSRFIAGTDGSLTLVIGSNATPSPRCLIYPNGLSPDLSSNLISSGHLGCWSLYPPGQVVTIVNVGTPSQSSIQSHLKNFRPDQPRIKVRPGVIIGVGDELSMSSTATMKLIRTTLLNLPLQVRFKPISYSWGITPIGNKYVSARPIWKPDRDGTYQLNLKVSFSAEYSFPGLTNWRMVKPNILLNSTPLPIRVSAIPEPPSQAKPVPRLVQGSCSVGQIAWGC